MLSQQMLLAVLFCRPLAYQTWQEFAEWKIHYLSLRMEIRDSSDNNTRVKKENKIPVSISYATAKTARLHFSILGHQMYHSLWNVCGKLWSLIHSSWSVAVQYIAEIHPGLKVWVTIFQCKAFCPLFKDVCPLLLSTWPAPTEHLCTACCASAAKHFLTGLEQN